MKQRRKTSLKGDKQQASNKKPGDDHKKMRDPLEVLFRHNPGNCSLEAMIRQFWIIILRHLEGS